MSPSPTRVEQAEQPVEADGRTIERAEIKRTHVLSSLKRHCVPAKLPGIGGPAGSTGPCGARAQKMGSRNGRSSPRNAANPTLSTTEVLGRGRLAPSERAKARIRRMSGRAVLAGLAILAAMPSRQKVRRSPGDLEPASKSGLPAITGRRRAMLDPTLQPPPAYYDAPPVVVVPMEPRLSAAMWRRPTTLCSTCLRTRATAT